jgi:protein TonB
MKKFQTLVFFLVVSLSVNAQVDPDLLDTPPPKAEEVEEPKTVLTFVEQMPEFEGGQQALMNFISKNMVYPQSAVEDQIEGRVYLNFVVSSTGEVEDIRVSRSVPGGEALNKEAIRVIKLTNGKWIPGKQLGKTVNVAFTLPIVFKLD